MRAAVFYRPHEVAIEDRPVPIIDASDDVLVRVRRAAICGTDAAEWDHGPVLTRPPVILGHEFTGEVVSTGSGVTDLSVGQRVVSGAGIWCGTCQWCKAGRPNLCSSYETLGLQRDGGLAEFVRVPARTIRPVADSIDDDAAALAQPLAVAIHAVKRSRLRPGETCVVIGTGGIGSFIVATARARGASEIIAIDVDQHRLETAAALGATQTHLGKGARLIDVIRAATGVDGADVIIEATGAAEGPAAAIGAIRRGGRIVLVGLQGRLREIDLLSVSIREIEIIGTVAHVCDDDLPEALSVLERGDLAPKVVDRTITLDELVPVGIAALLGKTAKGKFLIDPAP
jgi:(R,R)-butanediol dehydrogenase / meso-butanediol dehydrogenase / diacetyl reductase